jgi:hypothetical protein
MALIDEPALQRQDQLVRRADEGGNQGLHRAAIAWRTRRRIRRRKIQALLGSGIAKWLAERQ